METTSYQHPTLCLCPDCGGIGAIHYYFEGDILQKDPLFSKCKTCIGTGRVMIGSTTVTTVKPYVMPEFHKPLFEPQTLVTDAKES